MMNDGMYRYPGRDLIRCLQLGVGLLMEDKLRLFGKIFATGCIAAMAFWTNSDPTYMGGFVSAIWVFNLREFVEAWYLVRSEKREADFEFEESE